MPGKACSLGLALLATLVLVPAARAVNPRVAGLQVALRAYGAYAGPVDGIAGPQTIQATRAFQRRAGLVPDGVAGPRTRRAFGPLGGPPFGSRIIRRPAFGWDVSILQFVLARRGRLLPIDGYYDRATELAVRRYQRAKRLHADGVVGRLTLRALAHERVMVRARSGASPEAVRALLGYWSRFYGLDPGLVRALAWMESGYQPGVVSRAGARGVLQVLPSTKQYVETYLLHRHVPWTVSGGIQVGVVYLRELLRRSNGDVPQALAVWYQGPTSVARDGVLPETRHFVADVLALRSRGV